MVGFNFKFDLFVAYFGNYDLEYYQVLLVCNSPEPSRLNWGTEVWIVLAGGCVKYVFNDGQTFGIQKFRVNYTLELIRAQSRMIWFSELWWNLNQSTTYTLKRSNAARDQVFSLWKFKIFNSQNVNPVALVKRMHWINSKSRLSEAVRQ